MTTRTPVPGRGLTTVLTLVIPLAVLIAGMAWVLAVRSQLPDPVATHWAADGTPDGFGSITSTLVVLGVLVPTFALGMWAIGFFRGSASGTRRMVASLSVGFSVMVTGLLAGSLAVQRGLGDARQADGIGAPLALSLGGGLLFGILAAVVVPSDRPQPTTLPVPDDAGRVPLGATEQAVWVRTVSMPGLGRLLIVLGLVALLGGAAALAGPSILAPAALTALILAVVFFVLGRWTVTVDQDGLTARCLLPRPRTVVPLEEVESAEVVEVQPLADFGGWGYRLDTSGRIGIVLRAGEAIQVHRTGGRRLLVTVDDAATGAALLNTLADRSRLR